jgi:O-antigen/teichoic acid export membrane protein
MRSTLAILLLPTAALANGAMGAVGVANLGVAIAALVFGGSTVLSIALALFFAWTARRKRTRGWLTASAIMLSLSIAVWVMLTGTAIWYGVAGEFFVGWAILGAVVAGALWLAVRMHRQAVTLWRATP